MEQGIYTNCVNGELQPGDLVVSTPNDSYACLVGTVLGIDKLGTPEHSTDNDTDDVHVDFFVGDYSDKRIMEIEAMFSDLYGEPREFGDCPIDDTIMSPDCLIRITGIEQERLTDELLYSEEKATAFCDSIMRVRELTDRLTQNLNDYHDSLMNLDREEIISDAGMIAAVIDTHYYLTESHDFEDSEVDYLLLFENPLAVVAERWCARTALMDDFPFALDEVFSKREALDSVYRLYEKPIPPMPVAFGGFANKEQMARHEAQRLLSELNSIRTPNHPNKEEYMAKVSPEFIQQFDGDWHKPLTALTGVIRPFIPAFGHFGHGEDVYIAVSAEERDIVEVTKPTNIKNLHEAAKNAVDSDVRVTEQKTEDRSYEKKPSILEQLQAARQTPTHEKQPKQPGVSKDEPR